MKFIYFILFTIIITIDSLAQIVSIPDPNFLKALKIWGVDANQDGQIQLSEALATTTIDASYYQINSLTGLNAFINLTSFQCSGNQLTTLDVSQNTRLISFQCAHNQLTNLDISNNLSLEFLDCGYNKLKNLEVGMIQTLIDLRVENNLFKNIDISNNIALKNFVCPSNQIVDLDVSKNLALERLTCDHNLLVSLDVSKNTLLESLWCDFNPSLSSICVFSISYADKLYLKDEEAVWTEGCLLDGIHSPPLKAKNILYPNPSISGIFQCQSDVQIQSIRLINQNNQTLMECSYPLPLLLDLSKYPKGSYIAKIKTSNGWFEQKLLLH